MKVKPLVANEPSGTSSRPLPKISFESKEELRVIYCNNAEANKLSKFAVNSIKTTKYTPLTFVPKNLFEQFRRLANAYFLVVALIQLIPNLSPVNPYTSLVPLVFVLAVTAVKEGVEDFKRGQSDKKTNAQPIQALKDGKFTSIEWKDVLVGDIVHVSKGEPFPADLLLLNSSETQGLCYIETANLDGETNLKLFQALPETTHLTSTEDLARFSAIIMAELPNNRLYNFSGSLTITGDYSDVSVDGAGGNVNLSSDKSKEAKRLSLGVKQVLLRGSVLKNTDWITGVVIYSGKETKLMQNATNPPSKRTTLERMTNRALIRIFCIVMIVCLIGAFGSGIWLAVVGNDHWYLSPPSNKALTGFGTFFTFMISFSVMIPISLYVSMEMVKVLQALLIGFDTEMYFADNDTPAKARTSNLSEELGQIEYIFSDKTGTLTRNQMEFLKCSINGVSYGKGLTEIAMTKAKREGRTIEPDNSPPLPGADPNFAFKDNQLLHDLETNHNPSIKEFFSLLAVAHTVIPEVGEKGEIIYQAASPDEGALVDAARNLGFNFHTRNPRDIICNIRGTQTRYEILAVLEFNSTRKRMSVICRNPQTGTITLYCKGADTVIMARLRPGQDKLANVTVKHLEEYANDGLRTLCLAYTNIEPAAFEAWFKTYNEASTSIIDREDKLMQVAENIEKELILLGCTAIEDKLQVGVPDAILCLARAGLKIWVLTGDKQETAINIGFACSLLTSSMTILIVNSADEDETGRQLEAAMSQREEGGGDFGFVIDGLSLGFALAEHRPLLLKLATSCRAVLCCRVSPLQKAQVVALVKDNMHKVTLAIGDGANDVSMIQQAHIGVGISGQEGMQAVMSADYAIAQFRFLQPLLLVHGRWSYKRVTKLILYSFYKNMVFALTQFWINWYTGFSGQTMYDGWSITIFNVVFTGLPIIAFAIQDQDVSRPKCSKYPRLYESGQKGEEFSMKLLFLWLFNALCHSLVIFFFFYLSQTQFANGKDPSLWEFGATDYAAVVLVVNLRLGLELHTWNWITGGALVLCVLAWFVWMLMMTSFEVFISDSDMYQVAFVIFERPTFWLGLLAVIGICILPNLGIKYVRNLYWPESSQIVREEMRLEKHNELFIRPVHHDEEETLEDYSASSSPAQNFAIRKAMNTMSFHTSSEYSEERFTGFAFSDERGAQDKLKYSFKRQNTEGDSNNIGSAAARRSFSFSNGGKSSSHSTVVSESSFYNLK